MNADARRSSTDKSVRSFHIQARLIDNQIIVVKQAWMGCSFSFPAAEWPKDAWKQKEWIERLTPWWDMDVPSWSPQATRMRESCMRAITEISLSDKR
jgi:hypothetical protein